MQHHTLSSALIRCMQSPSFTQTNRNAVSTNMRPDYRFNRINNAELGTQANRQPIPTQQREGGANCISCKSVAHRVLQMREEYRAGIEGRQVAEGGQAGSLRILVVYDGKKALDLLMSFCFYFFQYIFNLDLFYRLMMSTGWSDEIGDSMNHIVSNHHFLARRCNLHFRDVLFGLKQGSICQFFIRIPSHANSSSLQNFESRTQLKVPLLWSPRLLPPK